jgi:hypothetical protein
MNADNSQATLRSEKNYNISAQADKCESGEAIHSVQTIGCADCYTVFQFGDHEIRFRAPYSLERYTEIKEWNHGYLVVMAKYQHNADAEEEYIDLVPILKEQCLDPDEFLEPIKEVRVDYGQR